MAKINLVVGPVGAGKSTFAAKICKNRNTIRFSLDEWMAVLFSQDRPEIGVMEWYAKRVERCTNQIWKIVLQLIQLEVDVVLEIGLIQRHDRNNFVKKIKSENIELAIYVLDAPRELRRKRVEQRNIEKGSTFSMVVPMEIFELASNLWEPVTDVECADLDVHFISTE